MLDQGERIMNSSTTRACLSPKRPAFSVAVGALILGSAGPALAQSVPDATPQEDAATAPRSDDIVVTATRRGNIQVRDIPLAIAAVSGEALKDANVTSLQDLRKIDPAVNITTFGAGQQRTVIRGIQSQAGATTGLYLDEMPIVGGTGAPVTVLGDGRPALQLRDVDHVEILKGPQGTLFGSGSVSGTLRVITAKPDLDRLGGHAEGSIGMLTGGTPSYDGSVTLNVPIVKDAVGIRAVTWGQTGGGYIDQTISGVRRSNVNDSHIRGFRVSALLKPTSDFSLLLSAVQQRIDVDGVAAWLQDKGAYNSTSPSLEFFREKVQLYNATADYDVGFGNIVASGSYDQQDNIAARDSSTTARLFRLAGTVYVPTINFKYQTGELRFSSKFSGPFQVVTGVYYEHDKNLYATNAVTNNMAGGALCYTYAECIANGFRKPGVGNSAYQFGTQSVIETNQYTAYVQGDYALTSTLTATLGFRYFKADTRTIIQNRQTIFPDFFRGILTPLTLTSDETTDDRKPSYNVSLLWKATPDISVYARAASGFRIGGTNGTTSLAQQAGVLFPATFGPDSLWNYEAGVKGTLFDRRLSFELSGYRIDWTGQQLVAQSAGGAFTYTINAGITHTNGVELNLRYRPDAHLTLAAGGTYVDSKLGVDLPADVAASGTVGRKGDRLPFTARYSATGSAEYRGDIGQGVEAYGRGSVNYRSKAYSSFSPASTFYTKLPAFAVFGAEAGIRTTSVDYGISVENITDKVVYLGVYDSIEGIRIYSPSPRTISVKAALRF